MSINHPEPQSRIRAISNIRVRPIFLIAAAVLCVIGLELTHGSRIATNWRVLQWEDQGFFQYNIENIHRFADCFLHRGAWPGLYRPLTTNLYYFLGLRLFDNRIEVYHAINLIFLVLNSLLFYHLAALFLGETWGLIPLALFASRLAMIEVVLHTCEFQGLLCAFFSLLSIDLFIRARVSGGRWRDWCSIVSFVLALLSKESAAVLPGILLVFGWLFDSRLTKRPYSAHAITAVVWAVAFREILRQDQPSGFIYDLSVANVLGNYAAHALDFSNYLLNPLDDRMAPCVTWLANMWLVKTLVAVTILGEITLIAFSRFVKSEGVRVVVFGVAWFFVSTLPFAVFEGRLFMRYSYFGHAGLALCAGALAREFARFASGHDLLASNPA